MAERTGDQSDVALQPRSEDIRRDIENTRASLDEKLDALQTRVRQVQNKAKQVVDIRHQARRHPWMLLGASIAVGFVAGMMTGGRKKTPARRALAAGHEMAQSAVELAQVYAEPPPVRVDAFNTVKLAARNAISDLARQVVIRSIPTVVEQVNAALQKRVAQAQEAAAQFSSNRNGGSTH